ncbi:LexA family transcriptional regulator [Phocaeicola faecium]|uniref:Helix-turn-helix domain-containing protein n=1 Tax=Phocaeicola faecium TaxID=2762213 RepID=A0ABR8V9X9_9BACT|nr:S24 family peptidase [Phocaeicola faecium]MBD8001568.1 helix-turn-helix domain-containing protein [Phocaeicola faecium]
MEAWERIQKIMDEEGLNKNSFSKAIGISNNVTITRIINEKRSPSKSTCEKIVAAFPKYNLTWLLTGEGNMLTDITSLNEASFIDKPIILHVPLVSQYAQAGYLCGYADAAYMATLPTIPYIVDHEAQGHYVAFEVKGDSMNDGTEDSILEGDRLLCREIMPHLWADSKLHFRKWDFVIIHSDGILVKRIIDHDVENHTITIHSLNSLYPDKVINLADVKQIFNVIELQRPRRR